MQPTTSQSLCVRSRKVWIVGLIASAILPFFGIKFGPLLKLKQEVDSVVDTVEDVAEVIEKVAEEVQIVDKEIAEHLPAGGKLKVVATFIENVAETTDKDARLAEDVIDKVIPNKYPFLSLSA
ncbi:hypothetical protein SO802_004611 [Lithocarpus litseifolius]|uniref:Uncharacterized protein n=1 Tax=Lithocarpus litseifolius TaxID=425828 RepID=A0AAW2E3G0_9ROSI